jgi:IclR family pca regulon transcriptional regulator
VEEVKESCSAAVLDGADIVYVLRVPTRKIMRIGLGVGSRLPASCTSMGRMLLAALTDAEVQAVLQAAPPAALTRYTLTEPDAVLAKVRRRAARAGAW